MTKITAFSLVITVLITFSLVDYSVCTAFSESNRTHLKLLQAIFPSQFSLLRGGLKNTLGICHLKHGCLNSLNKKILNCSDIESFLSFETLKVFLSSSFNLLMLK